MKTRIPALLLSLFIRTGISGASLTGFVSGLEDRDGSDFEGAAIATVGAGICWHFSLNRSCQLEK
jgi:hypothetical protein